MNTNSINGGSPFWESLDYFHSDSEESFDYEEFNKKRKDAEEKFKELQNSYSELFICEKIREAKPKEKPPSTTDVDMEEIAIDYAKDCTGFSTTAVGICLVVMARADSKEGTCLALSHTAGFTYHPNELLEKMTSMLKEKECDEKTIKFYIVGGQLPYRDRNDIPHSIEEETEFLRLSKEYPIAGVEFNCAEGVKESLEVYMTADEIVWEVVNNSSEKEESTEPKKRKVEDQEDDSSIKKPRFEGLPDGQIPNFV